MRLMRVAKSLWYWKKNRDYILDDGFYYVDGNVDLNQGTLKKKTPESEVAIFVNGSFYLNGNSSGKGGQVGEPSSPILIFSKSAEIKGRYFGYLYSMGEVAIQTPHGDFCGRLNASDLNMVAHAEIDSSGDCSYDFSWFDEKQEK
ncbi:hypothetical protein MBH78_21670 [Oceanimonas sp. NS1]|nr:hypothetical protein [Oceanimonas sp. NS1]